MFGGFALMNTMTTRTIAALAATGAIVVGGASTANATTGDSDGAGVTPDTGAVEQLFNEAVEDGRALLEKEDEIKQNIADRTGLETESLDDSATLG
jgi:hypothetical protein